ncbi:SDR family NAD(P)-dependent oxidoreductase [Salipiger profundus]|uniref:SDR family NAD(P)-dependent oxidoreductase n=1 Tax=Salipiger profundus TaxID=1229727 RepID=UPI0008EB14A3|nr:SDR family NAD(P)-dependent oxidoreductase [Salipiger profundus]SFD74540.1 NADP-dependent 3-hydroxy acid dehydrogenase YdfG [Salipiger profundus]
MIARVALVSGASRGIGLAVARTLQQNDWSLSLGLRDTEDVAPELSRQQVVQHDARQADEQAWVQAALDRFGGIDAVACCAGIMTPKDIVEIDDETLDAMWEVNVKSPRRLVSAAWEPLKQSGQGRVAVLASLSGKRVKSSAPSSYALTKHAAVVLVHGFRQTGREHGIRATAIMPGLRQYRHGQGNHRDRPGRDDAGERPRRAYPHGHRASQHRIGRRTLGKLPT